MKKLALVSFLSLLAFSQIGCLKSKGSCNPRSPQSEESAILAYASSNGINGQLATNGIYYEIVNPGNGVAPNSSSKVFVRYTGKLTNGTIFDSQSNSSLTGWVLGGLIPGWQLMLPLIQEGGHIKMVLPSSLAYGCGGVGAIPGNSILFFDVELVDVQ